MADLKSLVLNLCMKHKEGLTQARMTEELGGNVSAEELMAAISVLVDNDDVRMFKRKGASGEAELVFRGVEKEDREKFRGLSSEDMLVYQHVKASKDHGIWVCHWPATRGALCSHTFDRRAT